MKARIHSKIILLVLFVTLFPLVLHGQEGIGLPFLKIGVGARQAGMGNVFTGIADDLYAAYWNPGGLGHIRRWGWSVAYNKWFMDVYQANLTLIQQFRIIGSRKTTIGLMCTYLGMPSWDSTNPNKNSDPVSASHLVAGISVGQRLDWIHPSLSIGFNVKGISSNLDTYSAQGLSADGGILFKSPRFNLNLGLFDYGIISVGVSVLHHGRKITFDSEKTALPRMIRGGVSYRMGKYGGFSLMLASDGILLENKYLRDIIVGVAGELWWHDILGVRAGYKYADRDLDGYSFGVSLRFDDVFNSIFDLPSRHGDAIEIDLANAGYGDVLQETYRGSFSHYPIAPEPFRLEEPQVATARVMGETSMVRLDWEEAEDPDPFDRVSYLVIIDRDKRKIDEAIRMVERDIAGFMVSDLKDSLMLCESTPSTQFATSVYEGGIYQWAVAAYDLKGHARLAKKGKHKIAQFIVETADLTVDEITFTPSPWITTTPEQGTLSITITNEGIAVLDHFRVVIEDNFYSGLNEVKNTLLETSVPGFGAQNDTTFYIRWSTSYTGPHFIQVSVDPDSVIFEIKKNNNRKTESIVSIPKGNVLVADTVEVVGTEYDYLEIPLVPEVYFGINSSVVQAEFYTDGAIIPSVLTTLARRLQANPHVILSIMGSIDALSGETNTALADERAERIKTWLTGLGVQEMQVEVIKNHPHRILGRETMPATPEDANWIMEQNRVVTFSVPQPDEESIFGPHRLDVDTTLKDSVAFRIRIESPAEVDGWSIKGEPGNIEVTNMKFVDGRDIAGILSWNGADRIGILVPRNHWYRYSTVLIDTLGRMFKTRTDSVYLSERRTIRRMEAFGSAKFAETEPVYLFYWDKLMDVARELVANRDMRLRFEGHACKIGPVDVNQRLSYSRSQRFTEAFKERLRQAYPNHYQEAWGRVDPPVGYGESVPMILRLGTRREVMLGDNRFPEGRYLNRRTIVSLYRVR